jgi:glycosyltransferase involved in cell wall biosynthesis
MVAPHGKRGFLRRSVPVVIKNLVRRHAARVFVSRNDAGYETWLKKRIAERRTLYPGKPDPGLFSILTPVWNGSPLSFLKQLADSIKRQNEDGASEWIVLDNGCIDASCRRYLGELARNEWVKLLRVPRNLGIVLGLRHCLEHASGRYVLPVDADDYLLGDALRVAAHFVKTEGFPVIVYTDEDKIIGGRPRQPYFKPDWDPVLFGNSAYIAHLNVVDRKTALEVGAYTDPKTEGSADWDLFVRIVAAGHTPKHLPEVLYSWRIHSTSTADDAANKKCIPDSQRAVLTRLLETHPAGAHFKLRRSPFAIGDTDWHFQHQATERPNMLTVVFSDGVNEPRWVADELMVPVRCSLRELASFIRLADTSYELMRLKSEDVIVEGDDWVGETLGLFELYPDTVMAGGRIRNSKGVLTSAGYYFGFAGARGCPHKGKSFCDPGYFTHIWKQRSVSAVCAQLAVAKTAFLLEAFDAAPESATAALLGPWAGAYAARTRHRVIYTPFISGVSDIVWDEVASREELDVFARVNSDLIPDHRYYSQHLSLKKPFAVAQTTKALTPSLDGILHL